MIRYRRTKLIGLLMALIMLTLSGCGSSPPKPRDPSLDTDLERFNRVARLAFDKGRFEQAASFYRRALDRAYLRDDTAAILDARYNLAVCLLNLQSYEEALEVVRRANTEMTLMGRDHSVDFMLLEATILHRAEDLNEAWQVTDQILSAPAPSSAVIKSKTHFLRGLMASEQDDLDQLRASIAALGQPNEIELRANRQELLGRLAMAEQDWDVAIEAFDGTTDLRREALDYHAMVRALVLAGEANEKAGHIRKAAVRYLRAGRSAFWQDQFGDAHKWLNQSAQLANTAGEDKIVQEARSLLRQIEALTAAAPDRSGQKATLLE